MNNLIVPADVPENKISTYLNNLKKATHNTGRLMLFAGDQKIEHLNDDFYGEEISEDDNTPEHLFKIASNARIGVLATQMGLISRYGRKYNDVPYLVKVNSKTNLIKTAQQDPLSTELVDIENIIDFACYSGLNILGIGFTIYIGSEYENIMLNQAANAINLAHKHGLISVLWMYPRGQAVPNEKDAHLIAGAAGVGASLGADFVKVNYPNDDNPAEALKEAVKASGNTGLVCAGGSSTNPREFLQRLHDQIHISGANGNATGRNIHQKPLDEAIKMCNAISEITLDNKNVEEVMNTYYP